MKTILRLIFRLLLSATFVLSGAIKLRAPDRFLLDVEAFALVPAWFAFATALVLPWIEVLAGVALWWPRLRRGAALLLLGATASFIAALVLAEWRGLELDCGCFGDWLVFPNLAVHLGFNLCLLFGAAWLTFGNKADSP